MGICYSITRHPSFRGNRSLSHCKGTREGQLTMEKMVTKIHKLKVERVRERGRSRRRWKYGVRESMSNGARLAGG